MTEWVRLWHDMPTDPKWRAIARKSGQPLASVIAMFTLMMTNASANADARGALLAWDHEDAAAALDIDEADARAIFDAMQGKVLDGARLTGWERRQPKREDSSAGRVAKHRQRLKEQGNAPADDVTQCNAPETDAETEAESPSEKSEGAKARKRAPRIVDLEIPDWMPSQAWADFCDMRRRQSKSAFTVAAAKGIVADLVQFHAEGHDVEAILMKSVKRGYRGVFKPEGPPPPPRGEQTDWTPERRQAHLAAIEQRGRSDPPPPPRERGRGGGARPIGKLIGHVGA